MSEIYELFSEVLGLVNNDAKKIHSSCKTRMLLSNSFSDSVSPAFLIRVGAAMEYSGSGEEEEDGKVWIFCFFVFLIFYF